MSCPRARGRSGGKSQWFRCARPLPGRAGEKEIPESARSHGLRSGAAGVRLRGRGGNSTANNQHTPCRRHRKTLGPRSWRLFLLCPRPSRTTRRLIPARSASSCIPTRPKWTPCSLDCLAPFTSARRRSTWPGWWQQTRDGARRLLLDEHHGGGGSARGPGGRGEARPPGKGQALSVPAAGRTRSGLCLAGAVQPERRALLGAALGCRPRRLSRRSFGAGSPARDPCADILAYAPH